MFKINRVRISTSEINTIEASIKSRLSSANRKIEGS